MATNACLIKVSTKIFHKVAKNDPHELRKNTLEEMKANDYSLDSNVSSIFDELISADAIELPDSK